MDACRALAQFVEKLLIHRGVRGLTCRVYPPAAGVRNYSLILQGDQIWERFSVSVRMAERFAETGDEHYVLSEIRAAFRELDKVLARRRKKGRS